MLKWIFNKQIFSFWPHTWTLFKNNNRTQKRWDKDKREKFIERKFSITFSSHLPWSLYIYRCFAQKKYPSFEFNIVASQNALIASFQYRISIIISFPLCFYSYCSCSLLESSSKVWFSIEKRKKEYEKKTWV